MQIKNGGFDTIPFEYKASKLNEYPCTAGKGDGENVNFVYTLKDKPTGNNFLVQNDDGPDIPLTNTADQGGGKRTCGKYLFTYDGDRSITFVGQLVK